jgi:hypothetical protein
MLSACSHSDCRCKYTAPQQPVVTKQGLPDPRHFELVALEQVGPFLLVKIVYPDSHNYEGRKILVFENVTESQLRQLTMVDPHFCDDKEHISPVARFVPTKRGLAMARAFCLAWSE